MNGQFPPRVSRRSKLEPARELHDMEGIILLLDLTQPLHVLTIHLLQRRAIQRIVGVTRHILQVLAVLDPGLVTEALRPRMLSYAYLSRDLSFHATRILDGRMVRERAGGDADGPPCVKTKSVT